LTQIHQVLAVRQGSGGVSGMPLRPVFEEATSPPK